MLDLANPEDRKTLEEQIQEDVNTFCETYYKQGHREHLGASELGEACWRKLYYKFRWVKQEWFSGRMQRLFNVGHSAEPRFIEYLRGIGFDVKEFQDDVLCYHPESGSYFRADMFDPGDGLVEDVTGIDFHELRAAKAGVKRKQFRISNHLGHYGGSLDGMCKAPYRYNISEDLIFLNEFKTNGTGSGFTSVDTDGVAKAKPKHYKQMCQYGYRYQLKYGIYLIENKNDSAITVKIVELDWNLGRQLEDKAGKIIFATEPPARLSENESFFDCKYCNFAGICHRNEPVEKNCRSCRFAMPTNDASWTCSRFNQVIPPDFIKLGCDNHNPI